MRLHYLQHLPFEEPALLRRWAQTRGHTVTGTRLDRDKSLPSPDQFDGLIVLGGLMSVHQHDAYPWLAEEKELIRRSIQRGKLYLGVCLGAQLAAEVLGGIVSKNPHKEIGWYSVTLTAAGMGSPFLQGFPKRFTALHWHGETFSIPRGAERLAFSAACSNQAFQYREHVLGVQFHLDFTEDAISRMIKYVGDELVTAPWIEGPERLYPCSRRVENSAELFQRLLDSLARHYDSRHAAQPEARSPRRRRKSATGQ